MCISHIIKYNFKNMLEHSEQRYNSTTKKLRQVSTTNYKIKEPHSTYH